MITAKSKKIDIADEKFCSELRKDQKSKKCSKRENIISHCDQGTFQCTILQKASKSGCINKTKFIINQIMDAREKHQKNMYFCKY